MASVEKTIKIIFDADDQTAKAVGSVTRGLGTVTAGVESLTAPLASAFDVIAKLNVAFLGLSATVIAFSVNSARKAEDALIELNKVMDNNADATDEQKQQIKDLAEVYAELGSETTLAVAEFKRSGFDFAESVGLTEVALKAMNATELDTVEASELLKRTMAGLGQNFQDSEETIAAGTRIMEVWNNASNIANTTVTEIGEAFKQLAPIMELTGLTFEETSGLATALIESFGVGSEVARGLKTAFINLASPTANVSRALEVLGVETKTVSGAQKSVSVILQEVADAWKTVDKDSRLALAGQIAGKDQASKFSKVMEGFNRVVEIQNELKKDTATLDAELAKRMDALSFKLRGLTSAYAAVGVSIGEAFLDGSKDQISALTNLTRAFDDVVTSGGLKPLFDLLNPLLDEFSKTINTVATNLPAAFKGVNFDPLIASFKLFGAEIESVFKAIAGGSVDLSTEEGLTKFIQALIDASADFVKVSASMFGTFEDLAGEIGEFVRSLGDMDDEVLDAIGGFVGFGKQLNVLLGLLPSVTGLVASLGGVFATVFALKYVSNIGAISTSVGLLSKALGKAGLIGVLYGVYEAMDYALNNTEFGKDLLRNAEELATEFADIFVFDEIDLSVPVSLNTQKTEEQIAAIKAAGNQAKGAYDELVGSINESFAAQQKAAEGTDTERAAARVIALGGAYSKVKDDAADAGKAGAKAAAAIADSADDAATGTKKASDATKGWIKTIEDGVTTYEQVGGAVKKATKTAVDETDKARRAAEAYQLQLLELASDERISIRKIDVEFDIAKLQEGTKRIQSSFESINAGIQSTGEVISSLFDTFTGANLFEKSEIRDQIAKENKYREQEFAEQKRLNDAEIERFRAEAVRFQDGIQIKVDAGTITPHLQAILRAMLVDSKIFMNENGAESLLSCA